MDATTYDLLVSQGHHLTSGAGYVGRAYRGDDETPARLFLDGEFELDELEQLVSLWKELEGESNAR
jgi:hypothetical protein